MPRQHLDTTGFTKREQEKKNEIARYAARSDGKGVRDGPVDWKRLEALYHEHAAKLRRQELKVKHHLEAEDGKIEEDRKIRNKTPPRRPVRGRTDVSMTLRGLDFAQLCENPTWIDAVKHCIFEIIGSTVENLATIEQIHLQQDAGNIQAFVEMQNNTMTGAAAVKLHACSNLADEITSRLANLAFVSFVDHGA